MRNPFKYIEKFTDFLREYITDMLVFMRYNNYSPFEDRNGKLFYQSIILSHTIEKGLSLREPRPLFGRDKIKVILENLRVYNKNYSEFPLGMAHGALQDYCSFNLLYTTKKDQFLEEIKHYLDSEINPITERTGGIKNIMFPPSFAKENSIAFLKSRASCRMFVPDPLPIAQINKVIGIAQAAPSQCNRQSVRLHFYQNRKQIADLLKLQGGSVGFSDDVGNLFIITSEITAWGGPQQRNQLYIDGGIYAMMLMLALHAEGIASCPLHLGFTNSVENDIKLAGNIPSNQKLIMMLAIGKTLESIITVAKSPRRKVSDIAYFH